MFSRLTAKTKDWVHHHDKVDAKRIEREQKFEKIKRDLEGESQESESSEFEY